jgi:hypothetical protein
MRCFRRFAQYPAVGWFRSHITTISLLLVYINIKRLPIDQLRKWVLRAWCYVSYNFDQTISKKCLATAQLASIITERLIFLAAQLIIKEKGSYWYAMPCSKILGIMAAYGVPEKAARGLYPDCVPFLNGQGDPHASVNAGAVEGPEQIAASLDISFGMCLWFALILHAIVIEIYVTTSRELSIELLTDDPLTSSHKERMNHFDRYLTRGSKRREYLILEALVLHLIDMGTLSHGGLCRKILQMSRMAVKSCRFK